MNERAQGILLAVAVTLSASACGGMTIRPPTPVRAVVISSFQVLYGPEIPGDRQGLLNRSQVPAKMAAALRAAYPLGQGPQVRVLITQFRAGRWGPTRMHAVVQVLGPGGQVLHQFEVDSTSVHGNRGRKIQAVSQDIVNQIAQQL